MYLLGLLLLRRHRHMCRPCRKVTSIYCTWPFYLYRMPQTAFCQSPPTIQRKWDFREHFSSSSSSSAARNLCYLGWDVRTYLVNELYSLYISDEKVNKRNVGQAFAREGERQGERESSAHLTIISSGLHLKLDTNFCDVPMMSSVFDPPLCVVAPRLMILHFNLALAVNPQYLMAQLPR